MTREKWQHKVEELLKPPFYTLTTTLLSLLLPLSFLLLARLTTAHYLFTTTPDPAPSKHFSLIFYIFLYTSPALLHSLVSMVSLATLIHGLTGKVALLTTKPPGPGFRPRLYTAWIFLCTLQVCVGVGIEGSIAAGVDGTMGLGNRDRGLLTRVIFFLGLNETMLHWLKTVVKPVVDDTVFGVAREERWVEKVIVAASFGGLWGWRLKEEVESLVIVAEVKKEMLMSVGVADFVGWWLYYLTVTIGMVRIVKGLMWLGMLLLCRKNKLQENSAQPVCFQKFL